MGGIGRVAVVGVHRDYAAVDAFDPALLGEPRHVAMDRHRGHADVLREIAQRHAAVALEPIEDLGPPQRGWDVRHADLIGPVHNMSAVTIFRLVANYFKS